MKVMRVFLLGFCSLFVLTLAALAINGWWENTHRIVPGPQNKSSFLQTYDPEGVITRFRYKGQNFSQSRSVGAAPDTRSIKHTADFDPEFTIESSRKAGLMTALKEDVMRRLALTDTKVVGKSEGADGGFEYEYVSGQSAGSISAHPPTPANVQRNMPLPNGIEDVTLEIDLKETWSRPPS